MRARALQLWWEGSEELGPWLQQRLQGPLALRGLDLPGQYRLQGMTRGFLAHFFAGTELLSETVKAQIQLMFPDWQQGEPAVAPQAFAAEHADEPVRHYLTALMLDLALADPDQQEPVPLRAGVIAKRWRRWIICINCSSARPASASVNWTDTSDNWPRRPQHE
jgi:hypothetical protein